jgi:hypothetical protein
MSIFRSRTAVAGLCLAALTSLATVVAADKAPSSVPDLSGTWQLNEDLSQTPQQAMRQSAEGVPPGGGRGGGMGRRGGGGRGGGFPGGGGGGFRSGGAPPEDGGRGGFEGPEKTMTIAWAAPQLTITYPSGRQRILYTDGRKAKEERPNGKTATTQASWTETGSLKVVTEGDEGRKRTEIYEITNDHRRLFILIGMEGRGPKPIQFRRAYDRAEEKKEGAVPPAGNPGDR